MFESMMNCRAIVLDERDFKGMVYFRIPPPVKTNIIPHQIPLKFPSNHPFSSHISEKALFPNSSLNLDDRPSTDFDPYIVTHKIRGRIRALCLVERSPSFSQVIHIVERCIFMVHNDKEILNGRINSTCR